MFFCTAKGMKLNMKKNRSIDAKSITLSGILLTLVVLALYAESLTPTAKLSLYAFSSLFVSIVIIESGIKAGWIFYLASSLLTLIIIPDKLGLVPYFVFFGIYGIIKYYIEKLNKLAIEYILKCIYFSLCLLLALFVVKKLLMEDVISNLPWWLIIIGLEVVFLIYDYVYTLFIQYYNHKLRKMIYK